MGRTKFFNCVLSFRMVNESSLMESEPVDPVTLSADWSRVARLLLVTALTVAGSVGNVFMISAVIIEDHLRKRGRIL